MDFAYRSDKLDKEAKARRDAAKKKREKEKRAQEQYELQQQKLEELRIAKLAADQKIEEQRQALEQEESQLTGGLTFNRPSLTPYRLVNSDTQEGYDDDKIILSEDCLTDLNNIDVWSTNEPCYLRIYINSTLGKKQVKVTSESTIRPADASMASVHDGKYTHAGIKEFSATENSIGLTDKVINTLYYHLVGYGRFVEMEAAMESSEEADEHALMSQKLKAIGAVSIKLIKMAKTTFIKCKPFFNNFSQVVYIKEVLTLNMTKMTTISVGDIMDVYNKGKKHSIRIAEIKPEQGFGSLINTDVEVDLDVSEEYDAAMERRSTGSATGSDTGSVVGASNDKMDADSTQQAAADVFAASQGGHTLGTEASGASQVLNSIDYGDIPAEPEATAEGTCRIQFRLPNGKSTVRRFLLSNQIRNLYAVAASLFISEGIETSPFRLIVNGRPSREIGLNEGELQRTMEEEKMKGAVSIIVQVL